MNFYIGKSIESIDIDSKNVEFSDELIQYLYTVKSKIDTDISILYNIDPYDDVVIINKDLSVIMHICHELLKAEILDEYEEKEEGEIMLKELNKICKEAISQNSNLISIGD